MRRPRWSRLSLRARLTTAAGLAVAALLAAASVLLVWRVHAGLLNGLDATVSQAAAATAEAVDSTGRARVPVVVGAAFTAQVLDASGRVVVSSSDIEGEPPLFAVPPASAGSPPTIDTAAVEALDGVPFRVAAVRTGSVAHETVYVALPTYPVDRSTRQLAAALAAGSPALLAILLAMTWILAGRALHPVEVLRRQAADIDGVIADRGRGRVDVPQTEDELSRLAVTLNDLLGRLEEAQRQQRQFIADAAHELRSPVAAIRVQVETADLDGAAGAALSEETVRLSRLVDDLLALARLDTRPPIRRQEVDLDDTVRSEVRSLLQRTQLAVDTRDVHPLRVIGDETLLARMIRNLLDNAARYAAHRITLSLTAQDRTAVLTVADDGPGIPYADRNRVFDRFTRLDDDRSRAAGGVGLGLAIVHDVITTHGGTVTVEDEAPGARLVVRLPALPCGDGHTAVASTS